MVYDLTMLEAFYSAYKGKVRSEERRVGTPFDVSREDSVCPPVQ